MKSKALNNQSLFDIALQETGTIESLFEIAKANTSKITSLSEPVMEGVQLVVEGTTKNLLVLNEYSRRNHKPGSAGRLDRLLIDSEGYYLLDSEDNYLTDKGY